MLVKDIMTKDVITVKKEASIREIAQTIVDHDVSGLPVMDDDGTVCGSTRTPSARSRPSRQSSS